MDTLDNIAADAGSACIYKIDVEGFESEVIRGMERIKAIIIELMAQNSEPDTMKMSPS